MKQQSIKLWVVLLAIPIPMIIVSAFVNLIVRSIGIEPLTIIMNIFGLLIGIVAVLLLLGVPVWIFMLIKTINDNKKISTNVVNQ